MEKLNLHILAKAVVMFLTVSRLASQLRLSKVICRYTHTHFLSVLTMGRLSRAGHLAVVLNI